MVPAPPEEQEHAVVRALRSRLLGEGAGRFADVTLVSGDGSEVPAVRALLAARSPVFSSMLFGEFAEARCNSLSLGGWRAETLRALVEFCYTDELALLAADSPGAHVQALVELATAGDFFQVPSLALRSCRKVECALLASPPAACALLQHTRSGIDPLDQLRELAWESLRQRPEEALLGTDGGGGRPGVVHLNSDVLESVLRDDAIVADESLLFSCLRLWVSAGAADVANMDVLVERSRRAQELAVHIRFSKVPPSFLRQEVIPSGLVDMQIIYSAYAEQAHLAEAFCGQSFQLPRRTLEWLWEGSGAASLHEQASKHKVETVRGVALSSGIHIWQITLLELCHYQIWVGVAAKGMDAGRWLGSQPGGWVVGDGGCDA